MSHTIARIQTSQRLSRAIVFNEIAFLAGVTADDTNEDIQGQTRQVLRKIEYFLKEAGSETSRMLTAQIWLKDIARDFEEMNAIWDSWTVPGAAPTRATAQCEMAEPEILIEIVVSAAIIR